MKIITLTTIALLLHVCVAKGQLMPMQEAYSKSVYIKTGYNYSILATSIGFKKYFNRYRTAGLVEVTQTMTAPGLSNMKLKVGSQSWFNVYKSIWLTPQLGVSWIRGQTKVANLESVQANIQFSTMINLKRFAVGIDLAYKPVLSTHIKHSEDYKKYYYGDAKDGWYKSTAQYYAAGLHAGYMLNHSRTFELTAEGGIQRSGTYDQLIPNFYFQLGLCKRFN